MDLTAVFEALGLAKSGIDATASAVGLAQQARQLLQSPEKGKVGGVDVAASEIIARLCVELVRAKQEQTALLDKLHELESALRDIERRDQYRARYEMVTTPAGVPLMALKQRPDETEPFHYACPDCFEDGKRAILQPKAHLLHCNRCGTDFARERAPDVPMRRIPGRHDGGIF